MRMRHIIFAAVSSALLLLVLIQLEPPHNRPQGHPTTCHLNRRMPQSRVSTTLEGQRTSLTSDNTASKWWKDPGLRKMMIAIVVLWGNAFTWGYDGTLLNALQSMPQWNAQFDTPTGDVLGELLQPHRSQH